MTTDALAGRVALVTGGSRGLGAAIVRGLAAQGAQVFAAARTEHQLAEVARTDPDRIATIAYDAADLRQTGSLVTAVVARAGRLDVLVNNAGVAPAADFLAQPYEEWLRVMTIDVLAPMRLAQAAGQQFLAQGSGGKIVNIASTTGLRGKPQLVAYSAAKGALLRMTEALAAEWARHNIQVNAIAPGAFRTHAQRSVTGDPELLARRVRRIPAGRMGEPAEIAPLVCLLASPASDFVTGSVFVIDGGEVGKL